MRYTTMKNINLLYRAEYGPGVTIIYYFKSCHQIIHFGERQFESIRIGSREFP